MHWIILWVAFQLLLSVFPISFPRFKMAFQARATTIMGSVGKLLRDMDELYSEMEILREQQLRETVERESVYKGLAADLEEENQELVEMYKTEKKKVKALKKQLKTEQLYLPTGTPIFREYNNTEYEARWDNEHQCIIDENGDVYRSPSGWAKSVSGKESSGWDVCYIWDEDEKIPLSRLRLTKRTPRCRMARV